MPSPLPRQVGGSCSLVLFHFIGLPQVRCGLAPASWFRCLLSVHSRYGLHACRVASTTLLHSEASAALLPPPLLRLPPGGTNQFPRETCTHCGLNVFSRRTRTIPLAIFNARHRYRVADHLGAELPGPRRPKLTRQLALSLPWREAGSIAAAPRAGICLRFILSMCARQAL
jgi:hypothetical protein